MATRPILRGTVTSFSDDDGLGEVTGEDGGVHPFHCTAISDGTRTVAVGTPVAFGLVPAQHGRLEARPVSPLD